MKEENMDALRFLTETQQKSIKKIAKVLADSKMKIIVNKNDEISIQFGTIPISWEVPTIMNEDNDVVVCGHSFAEGLSESQLIKDISIDDLYREYGNTKMYIMSYNSESKVLTLKGDTYDGSEIVGDVNVFETEEDINNSKPVDLSDIKCVSMKFLRNDTLIATIDK